MILILLSCNSNNRTEPARPESLDQHYCISDTHLSIVVNGVEQEADQAPFRSDVRAKTILPQVSDDAIDIFYKKNLLASEKYIIESVHSCANQSGEVGVSVTIGAEAIIGLDYFNKIFAIIEHEDTTCKVSVATHGDSGDILVKLSRNIKHIIDDCINLNTVFH